MEILTPSNSLGPSVDHRCVWSTSMTSILSSTSTTMAEPRRDKVYVAVGKSEEKMTSLLRWSLRAFRSYDICLLHVHQPSPVIPTLLGKLPASLANEEVVSSYREEEREKMKRHIRTYLNICFNAKVKASTLIVEAEQVQKGLLDLIVKHGIQKLVIGSVPENSVKMRSSRKASYTAKNAPGFCEIYFIYKGKYAFTREASKQDYFFPNFHANEIISEMPRSESFRCLYNQDQLRPKSSPIEIHSSRIVGLIQNEHTEEDKLLPCDFSTSENSYDEFYPRISTKNHDASITTFTSELEQKKLLGQLLKAKADAETSQHEATMEFLKRRELETSSMEAIRKVKDLESAYTHEAKLREESEDALRSTIEEQKKLLEERVELTGELEKAMRSVAVLDCRVREANHWCNEVGSELKLIQICIASLRQEKQRIQRQKMEAENWLEKWSHRRLGGSGGIGHGNYARSVNDVPELVQFSVFDVQTATCNFSDSFKIKEGGYGCIYKGELLDRTVVIRRLHAYNIQSPSQYLKEVQTLGNLRHPHLVNLIGVCPEAWSFVYDYVPNGTLQDRLFHKTNVEPLSWKIRTRIVSEISMALLFLHTSYPNKIVHGDLQPEAILLDSDLHCKICDFGTSRMLSHETFTSSLCRFSEPKSAFPYTDPEFHRTGNICPKSDLYSFGIVILQLLTGLPPVGLVSDVGKAVSNGKLSTILDLSAGDWDPFVAAKLADVALRFCEHNSRDRPELTPSLVKDLQRLHALEERQVPSFFLCPIFQEIMCDPQVAADGFTYEGVAIRRWMENGRETSPMTNLRLTHLHLTPNHSLRLAIHDWLCGI